MTLIPSERLVWCDVEAFGLDPETDPLLEVGFVLTDLELNVVDSISTLIWHDPVYLPRMHQLYTLAESELAGAKDALVVVQMHERSELFTVAKKYGEKPFYAERRLLTWLRSHGIGKEDPLCGSSVSFDRSMLTAQMSSVAEIFHHRNIDVSSIKETCARYNPAMYAHINEDLKPTRAHRVLMDCDDTIAEYRWYIDNFLFTSR